MKVHYPKLYNMTHLLALYFLLLPKDLTIIFILKILRFCYRSNVSHIAFLGKSRMFVLFQ